MINLEFNSKVKALGAKWNGSAWVAPELAQAEFDALHLKYNQDLVAVELTVTDNNRTPSAWLGNSHCVAIGGYVLATASGRDSGARLQDAVAVIDGKFSSGGSVKNYRCCINGDSVRVRCKIARAMIDEISAIAGTDLVVLEADKSQPKNDLVSDAIKLLTELGYKVVAPE